MNKILGISYDEFMNQIPLSVIAVTMSARKVLEDETASPSGSWRDGIGGNGSAMIDGFRQN